MTDPNKHTTRHIPIRLILAVLVVLLFGGFGLKDGACNDPNEEIEPTELIFWGVFDGKDVYDSIIKKYQVVHPDVKITYSKLTIDRYEQELIEALAAGRGPDVWLMQSTWLPRHLDKVTPAPGEYMSSTTIKDNFVDVVYDDFVLIPAPDKDGVQGNPLVYGVPLYVDTLSLYYNKDLTQSAKIVNPPETWSEFATDVRQMTETDDFGNVVRSGAAMGTADNVERSADILSLLMLQNTTPMVDIARQKATFDERVTRTDADAYTPGLDALVFYTDFANPKKVVYTWDPTKESSVDAFVNEDAAFLFHYQYMDGAVKARAPQLNYDIASIPQIDGAKKDISYANYWAHVVSKASPNQNEAWRFVSFLASEENAREYTQLSGRPSSRKDIIEEQLGDPSIAIFAEQALVARSWYQQDSTLIENIFADMISSVVLGTQPEESLQAAADQVTAVMRK